MAGAYLEIAIGETYTFTSNVLLDGAPVDLTGTSLYFLAKEDPENDTDADAIINATSFSVTNSVVTLTMANTLTGALDPYPLLFWQLKAVTSGGNVYGLDQGRLAVVQPVVRR